MRTARIKPSHQPVFHHLFNRVAGDPSWRPFGKQEKKLFFEILKDLELFFSVQVVSRQCLDNHFHLIAHVPNLPLSPQEVCRRYNAFYKGKRDPILPSDPCCAYQAERMNDISSFMHDLQGRFSSRFNRSRKRRGGLWAGRFKNTVLGDARAVWECLKYVELNPVRAGMVKQPAEYAFGSFGEWMQTGAHPHATAVEDVLLPYLQPWAETGTMEGLREVLKGAFEAICGKEKQEQDDQPFRVGTLRRVRYWADGLVIGTQEFVREIMQRYVKGWQEPRDGLVPACGPADEPVNLFAPRRLRRLS